MTDRMGSMQAAVIAARIEAAHDEVTHWQAAHPDAGDAMVNSLEYYLRHARNTARAIDKHRRTPEETS